MEDIERQNNQLPIKSHVELHDNSSVVVNGKLMWNPRNKPWKPDIPSRRLTMTKYEARWRAVGPWNTKACQICIFAKCMCQGCCSGWSYPVAPQIHLTSQQLVNLYVGLNPRPSPRAHGNSKVKTPKVGIVLGWPKHVVFGALYHCMVHLIIVGYLGELGIFNHPCGIPRACPWGK